MFASILVEPESSGNIGSIARVMKNFDIEGPLILVNPCAITDEAYKFACNAKEIIENAIVVKTYEEALKCVDFSVATSKEAGDEYNVNRIAILPQDLGRATKIDGTIGIVFGRESSGLSNDEIYMSDMLVTIPTDKNYPTMNISHAAAIIFYELYRSFNKEKRPIKLNGASNEEKELLFRDFESILNILEKRNYRKRNISIVFKHIISRSFISSREAYTLKGILRNILNRLNE